MKQFLYLAFSFLLCSCGTSRHVQMAERIQKDTVYLSNMQYDSIYIDRSSDTDRTRDTISVTNTITEYRYKMLRDTIYKHHTDTLIRTDTVCVYTPPHKGGGRERVSTWLDTLSYISLGILTGMIGIKLSKFMKPPS